MQSTLFAQPEFADFHTKRESGDVEVVARFSVEGEPISKSRARFTKRGSKTVTYTPQKTLDGEKKMADGFKAAAENHEPDSVGAFGVSCLFVNGTRQRRDVDNMIKLVLDGLNKVAWADDNQVSEVSARKEYTKVRADAHTEVIVYRVGKHHRRTKPCAQCGVDFDIYDSTENIVKFCSQKCQDQERADRMRRTCERCGVEFHADKTARRFCTRECAYASKRVDVDCTECGTTFNKQKCHVREVNYCSGKCNKAASVRKLKAGGWRAGDCQQCGGPVTRKEYKRCMSCRMSGSQASGKPKFEGARQ